MIPSPSRSITEAAAALDAAARLLTAIKPDERWQMDDECREDLERVERWLRFPPCDLERLACNVAGVRAVAPIYGART